MPKHLSIEPDYATPVQKLEMEKMMAEARTCDVIFEGPAGSGEMSLRKWPGGISVAVISEDEDQTTVIIYGAERPAAVAGGEG